MALFDFISGDEFRSGLESDYQELNSCMQMGAWKAAQVLAGSIIEAILIDYLIAIEYQKLSSSEILKWDLSKAITACRGDGILSEKTEHLSHVIRSYRNLIHPGRVVRLDEVANAQGAKIAQALVEIVIEEISTKRRERFGYTAEQVVGKLEHDPSARAILGYLLTRVNNVELERLLLKIIPQRYFDLMNSEKVSERLLITLEICFRTAFDATPLETKVKVTEKFARTIREESADLVWTYTFFRGKDLQYLSQEEALLVIGHFLFALDSDTTGTILKAAEGIGNFLTADETNDLTISLFYQMLINTTSTGKKELSELAKKTLETEYRTMGDDNQKAMITAIDKMIKAFEGDNFPTVLETIKEVRAILLSYSASDMS